jgi:hypothetical protein
MDWRSSLSIDALLFIKAARLRWALRHSVCLGRMVGAPPLTENMND